MNSSTGWPSRNSFTVGMLRMPNWAAISCSSSVFSLPSRNLPWYSSASLTRIGVRAWHGWHQLAQKSSSTGTSNEASMTCWKFSRVTSMMKG